jgi:hypothetical protein
MFKRLFWPTIENQYDLDLVGQQGFWVCFAIGVLSAVVLSFTGQALIGLLVCVTYVLGATGVRERSAGAAILIFSCYFLDRITSIVFGLGGFGVLAIVSTMLLLANVRATLLARRWRQRPVRENDEPMEAVERATETFAEKFANVYPTFVWPKAKFAFYPLAGLLLLLTVVGMVMMPALQRRQAAIRQQQEQQIITVTPSR